LKEQLTDDIYLDSVPIGKLQVPKATYYVFDGWFTSDGTPVTNSDGTFIDNVEGYIENGNWVRSNEKQTVLYARWVKTYNNYTYLSTVADLKKIGTTGNYLIINDIDYNGGTWTPISKFSGIINGLEHTIYNFKITEGIKDDPSSGFKTSTAGFIATNSGTIKNLQIGKSGYSTYISISSWNILKQCGMIAGYNSGTIANCRVVNCTISASAEANSDSYSKSELWVNCGAICGVIRGGSIQRCYVDSCTITATSKATYNGIQAMARAAGIAGFTANFSVSDCFVLNCKFSAEATTNGEFANKGGNATAHVGGLIGSANSESGNAAIIRSVVYNNSIDASATCKWGGSSNTYKGSMFGKTNDTSPKNLIMIDTTLDCSGSNSSYDNYIKIDKNSYSLLISKNSAFNNGYWKANSDGTITLDFTKLA
jgi:hypothetical protein